MTDRLGHLEATSLHVLREAYAAFPQLYMLWSMGKDSTVLLWLVRKAFFGHVPFPLIHIDTSFKMPEMIAFRDRLAADWRLPLLYGQNEAALAEGRTFPNGAVNRTACCSTLKTAALKATLDGTGPRYRFDVTSRSYQRDTRADAFAAVIVGIRFDEEGSRSKERYFSPRDEHQGWNVADQPPEFWKQFNTNVRAGTHIRIHPLLDWTELDIWEYTAGEGLPIVPLYFDQGTGRRYRSLGCGPCTQPFQSTAKSVGEVVAELKSGPLRQVGERAGRAQDAPEDGGLEALRREGYM